MVVFPYCKLYRLYSSLSVILRTVPDYCNEKITFETLYRKFIAVSIPSLDIFYLLLKLENFDNFAAGFKNKLLSDNGVYTFALNHKCNDFGGNLYQNNTFQLMVYSELHRSEK